MPPEERALLAAIVADPDDDTARLAYADWLDENADSLPDARREPARAKAELIRNQIERENLILGTPGFERRYRALQNREYVLATKENFGAWEEELDGITPARGLQFSLVRGLFGEVVCSTKYFVEDGAALFHAAPITRVRLKKLAASNVKSLAECPHFLCVRTLKLEYPATPHDAIFALLDRAPLSHLGALAIDGWLVDGTTDAWHAQADPLAMRIADCAKLSQLKRLNLRAAGVGEGGGRALAASRHLAKLDAIDLRNNPGLGRAARVLHKKFGKRVWLTHDDVNGLPIGYQDRE